MVTPFGCTVAVKVRDRPYSTAVHFFMMLRSYFSV